MGHFWGNSNLPVLWMDVFDTEKQLVAERFELLRAAPPYDTQTFLATRSKDSPPVDESKLLRIKATMNLNY